ncbi:NAD(P)-dependent oxidoreductase [Wukongibacter sp. M2B1]|uniref:NAD(P)-dependent oxidoreductase n=1 Tax=Wukongibacter sp. M2B1 TaxID=3088895 RepID=UPI003D79838C
MDDKKRYLTEAVEPFTPLLAMEEASRCLLCHDAPCSQGCPAGTDPGKFIRSLRFKNVKGAVETIREANILGGVCARVCPYDRLCEEACSRCGIDKPIQIGRLQRFATDFERSIAMKVLEAPEATKEKVAIIGSGPAGLATAAKLALEGYSVTVFEEKPAPGGVLTYGIVPARLPQDVVDQEIQYVKDLGVQFELNCKVGKDITLDELKSKGYAAFMLAIGMQYSKMLDIPGFNLDGVTNAVDFLGTAKPTEGNLDVGNNVIVIGGGDVAMDCATTARSLGADKVTIVYRRTYEEMPANKDEVRYVNELGVNFFYGFKPEEIVGKDGKVSRFRATGFRDDSILELKADKVIFAIGQVAEDPKPIVDIAVSLDGKNLVLANEETCETNAKGVFSAGDIVNGGKTVVEAVAAGKLAAESIDKYLTSLREASTADTEIAAEKEGVK